MTSPCCSYRTDGFCILCNFRSLFMVSVSIIQEAKKLPRKIDLEPVQRLKIILLISCLSFHFFYRDIMNPQYMTIPESFLEYVVFRTSKQDNLWRVNLKAVWCLGTLLGPEAMDGGKWCVGALWLFIFTLRLLTSYPPFSSAQRQWKGMF